EPVDDAPDALDAPDEPADGPADEPGLDEPADDAPDAESVVDVVRLYVALLDENVFGLLVVGLIADVGGLVVGVVWDETLLELVDSLFRGLVEEFTTTDDELLYTVVSEETTEKCEDSFERVDDILGVVCLDWVEVIDSDVVVPVLEVEKLDDFVPSFEVDAEVEDSLEMPVDVVNMDDEELSEVSVEASEVVVLSVGVTLELVGSL
ncbi:hypothetical protein JL09_g6015, partial [Pichia kudriavzevii]